MIAGKRLLNIYAEICLNCQKENPRINKKTCQFCRLKQLNDMAGLVSAGMTEHEAYKETQEEIERSVKALRSHSVSEQRLNSRAIKYA